MSRYWTAGGAGGLSFFAETSDEATYAALIPSGVNYGAVVGPNGTGFFSFEIPDSGAAGGNARGLYAVDLQTSRSAATEVASGSWSFVAGRWNTSSGNYAVTFGFSNVNAGSTGAILAGVSGDIDGAVSYAIILGGQRCQVSASGAVAMGVSALADHPYSLVLSGNTVAVSDAERGQSQTQIVDLDIRTTGAIKTHMDTAGTEFTVPLGLCSITGTAAVWNETDSTATDWAINILVKNVGGALTILRGGGVALAVQTTDDAGTPQLDIVANGAILRFDTTGINAKDMRWGASLVMKRLQT